MRVLSKTFSLSIATTIFFALLGLLGYIPGLRILGSIRLDYIPMAPSTAFSFLFLAFSLHISQRKPITRIPRPVLLIPTGLVILFAILEVVGYLIGVDLNREKMLIPAMGRVAGAPIGLMSPATGVLFVLSGLALLAMLLPSQEISRQRLFRWSAGYLATAALVGGVTFLLGYLFGTPLFYNSGTVPMALTTSLGFIGLNTALIVGLGENTFPLVHFTGHSTYSRLMRAFFPLLLAAILVQCLSAQILNSMAGLNYALAGAILASLIAIGATALFAAEARGVGDAIDQHDRERRKAESALFVSRQQYKGLFDSIRDAILVTDIDRNIIELNPAFTSLFGYSLAELKGRKTSCIYEQEKQFHELGQALKQDSNQGSVLKTINYRRKNGEIFPGETRAYFLHNELGQVIGFIGMIRDISEQIKIEEERERLIQDLQQALAEVKALGGLLPICSNCKKIRDDAGYWQQIEEYIQDHSDAIFSHSICPSCAKELYPDIDLSERD